MPGTLVKKYRYPRHRQNINTKHPRQKIFFLGDIVQRWNVPRSRDLHWMFLMPPCIFPDKTFRHKPLQTEWESFFFPSRRPRPSPFWRGILQVPSYALPLCTCCEARPWWPCKQGLAVIAGPGRGTGLWLKIGGNSYRSRQVTQWMRTYAFPTRIFRSNNGKQTQKWCLICHCHIIKPCSSLTHWVCVPATVPFQNGCLHIPRRLEQTAAEWAPQIRGHWSNGTNNCWFPLARKWPTWKWTWIWILFGKIEKKCPRYFRRDSRGNPRDLNMCRTGRSAALSRGRKSMPPRRESMKLVVQQRKFT